jgi:alkaline phosphatase D
VPVELEIARDPGFADVVRRRGGVASPDADYAVQLEVRGLDAAAEYHYRFSAAGGGTGRLASRAGSFRTLPRHDTAAPLRFVISGDANARFVRDNGLSFYVLSAAAAEEPDFFVYFGDTIYADSGVLPGGRAATTLDEYREVHRITRDDPHLQELLARTATYTGWDDHEVHNDYAGESVDPARFAAGAQSFFEYLPVRQRPGWPVFRTHRRVRFGSDVELFFLDGRQHRSAEQFCNPTLPDGPETPETLFSPLVEDEDLARQFLPANLFAAAAALLLPSDPECVATRLRDPDRTYLGRSQLEWLKTVLLESTATWKILINNTPIASLLFLPYDRWEGYAVEREELLAFIAANRDPAHVLVLTTDFHTNLALRRRDLTEVIVGPIATNTFGRSVVDLLPPGVPISADQVFIFLNLMLRAANRSLLGAEHDALSYALVEVFEDAGGESRLRVTVRGDPDYALGTNDPAAVTDLFSFELP